MRGDIVRIRPDVSVTSVSESETSGPQVLVAYDFGSELCFLDASLQGCELALRLGAGEVLKTANLVGDELDMVSMFLQHGWAVTTELEEPGRFQRQEAYFQARLPDASGVEVQAGLANARVSVIGCGGVGSNLALFAAMTGVGNLQLVDDDVIAASNQNRQIPFSVAPGAEGKPKAEFLAELLKRMFGVDAEAHSKRLDQESAELVRSFDPDVVVVAADEPSILDVVRFAIEQFPDRPILVGGGYLGQRSYVGPLLGVNGPPCADCLETAFGSEIAARPSRQNIGGTIGPIATHAASQASAVLIHHLTGLLRPDHPVVDGISQFDHDLGVGTTRKLSCAKCTGIDLVGGASITDESTFSTN